MCKTQCSGWDNAGWTIEGQSKDVVPFLPLWNVKVLISTKPGFYLVKIRPKVFKLNFSCLCSVWIT